MSATLAGPSAVPEVGTFDRLLVELCARALELDPAVAQHVDAIGVHEWAHGVKRGLSGQTPVPGAALLEPVAEARSAARSPLCRDRSCQPLDIGIDFFRSNTCKTKQQTLARIGNRAVDRERNRLNPRGPKVPACRHVVHAIWQPCQQVHTGFRWLNLQQPGRVLSQAVDQKGLPFTIGHAHPSNVGGEAAVFHELGQRHLRKIGRTMTQ